MTRALSVLIVSSNDHMRALLRDMLRTKGRIEVETASLHEEAQEWLRMVQFDFVLLHVDNDESDALKFVRDTRQASSSGHRVLVFVVTPRGVPALVTQLLEAGANWHLEAPVSQAALDQCIARL